ARGAVWGRAGGCGAMPGDRTLVRGAAPKDRPVVSAADRQAAAASTSAFGLDLYRALATTAPGPEGNLMVSPSSMENALGMLLPGARGRTGTELSGVLHNTLSTDRFTAALGALGRDEQAQADTDHTRLREADAVWTQKDFGVQRSYLQSLSDAFDTGVHVADFRTDPDGARRTVNDLVNRQTDGQIKDLFPSGAIDNSTRLVLTDAVTFRAKWQQSFTAADTADEPFHRLDGSTSDVRMMNHTGQYGYAEGSGWQAVELPYQGGHLAMDVLLPTSGGLPGFVSSLTPERLSQILGGLHDTGLRVALPRFTFDSQQTLNRTLARLGMPTAFDGGQADFGGIPTDPAARIHVQSVVQKAHVAVDEDGTTAAAGSGVAMGATATPVPRMAFRADRPFVFLIRDPHSGHTLFVGQVTDPGR
ncbi:serpin family protein, partial [Streptomyces sp. NPDC054933]